VDLYIQEGSFDPILELRGARIGDVIDITHNARLFDELFVHGDAKAGRRVLLQEAQAGDGVGQDTQAVLQLA
jgi:hypothetical protein